MIIWINNMTQIKHESAKANNALSAQPRIKSTLEGWQPNDQLSPKDLVQDYLNLAASSGQQKNSVTLQGNWTKPEAASAALTLLEDNNITVELDEDCVVPEDVQKNWQRRAVSRS